MNANDKYILEIDKYEAVNLLEALKYLKVVRGDTGDWHGQIYWRLSHLDLSDYKPNKMWWEQLEDFKLFRESIPPAPDPRLQGWER